MARNAEQLGAHIVGPPDCREPAGATAQNGASHRDGFHIVDGGGRAIKADIGREWRLHTRLALFAFEAFQKGGFFAADVSASTMGDIEIEIPAVLIALADELGFIGLVDGGLEAFAFEDVFTAHIDVANMRPHRTAGDEAAFDQQMRIVAHDFAVFAGSRFRFIRIDDKIMRTAIGNLRHERPFEARGEACPTAPTQAGSLHLVHDPIAAMIDEAFGLVPRATLQRAL